MSLHFRLHLLSLTVGFVCVPLVWAQKPTPSGAEEKSPPKTEAKTARSEIAYLGVDLESLHPALASHLPEALMDGQGVLVTYVSPDSPAEKAGLQSHDVLTTFDDQKLFAPEQLAKLVQHAKPRQEIALGIVRQGKAQKLNVALGARPYDPEFLLNAWEPGLIGNRNWDYIDQPLFRSSQVRNPDASWESFDSMTLRKTGDNRFKVEIQYLDKTGKKTDRHSFEGTREEIRRDIEAEKDLPATEREHLLRGLDLPAESTLGNRSAIFPRWGFGPWSRAY